MCGDEGGGQVRRGHTGGGRCDVGPEKDPVVHGRPQAPGAELGAQGPYKDHGGHTRLAHYSIARVLRYTNFTLKVSRAGGVPGDANALRNAL